MTESDVAVSPTRHLNKPHSHATIYIVMAVLVVVAGAGGFIGGMQVGKGSSTTGTSTRANGFSGQGRGGAMGRMGTFGTVTAVSSDSITITESRMGPQTQDDSTSTSTGTSKTYKITSSTTVTNSNATAAVSDIKSGDTVMIRTSTSDTSTATRISINPTMGGMPGAEGGNAQNSSDTDTQTDPSTIDGSST